MRRTSQFLVLSFAVLFVPCAARIASGQAVRAEPDNGNIDIFGGYTYIRANTVVSGAPINLNGGSASLAYNFNHWLGVVGDVGIYHQGSITANNLSLTVSSYQLGPRISLRRNERLTPFGQVLLGVGHAGGTLYTTSLGGGLAPIGSNYGFIVTAGGGVDWKLSHRLGVRLFQAEYFHSQFRNGGTHGNQQNNLRLSAGIVFSFGNH